VPDAPLRAGSTWTTPYHQEELLAPFSGHTATSRGHPYSIQQVRVPKWNNWGSVRVKLGNWLIACVCESTGWFTRVKTTQGKPLQNIVAPTPEFLAIKDQVIANSELFSLRHYLC
jgi:hypothetical protein